MEKQGKRLNNGWGPMINTGNGGLNKTNPIDTKEFFVEESKRLVDKEPKDTHK